MQAEDRLREGNLEEALIQLQDQVRKDPANSDYRVFLFQLLAVMGDWARAMTQLNVAGEMDPSTLAMVNMYGSAVRCEMLRQKVFAGERSPMFFGEPQEWMALMVEALRLSAQGRFSDWQTSFPDNAMFAQVLHDELGLRCIASWLVAPGEHDLVASEMSRIPSKLSPHIFLMRLWSHPEASIVEISVVER